MDADARRHQHLANRIAIVAHLKWRSRVEQVHFIVNCASETHRLSKPARPGGKHSSGCTWRKLPIPRHLLHTRQRFQRAQQHAACPVLGLASDIRAEVSPVDCIDIRMTCGTKENGVPRRGAAMGVRGRVGRIVVRAQVCLGLHAPPSQHPAARQVQAIAAAMNRSPNAVSKSLGRIRRLLLDCINDANLRQEQGDAPHEESLDKRRGEICVSGT